MRSGGAIRDGDHPPQPRACAQRCARTVRGVVSSAAPQEVFEAAQRSFDAGDFATAQALSHDVASQLAERCAVHDEGAPQSAACSIIVVSHRHSDGLDALAGQLAAYQQPPFELIFVNNGNARLDETVAHHLRRFKVVSPGFNYGCSGGRNLGAAHAQGTYLLFLDDDGVVAPNAIETLLDVIVRYQAFVVRGRIVPKGEGIPEPSHYDKGEALRTWSPDTEGLSIWRGDAFRRLGGFDPLLRGNEGVLLAAKAYPFFGPQAFLYTPHAVMRHDYGSSSEQAERKNRRHAALHAYLDHCEPKWRPIIASIRRAAETPEGLSAWRPTGNGPHPQPSDKPEERPISVITTARNGERFVAEYSQSLQHQTHQRFEVVFVDDGSEDGTEQAIKALWSGDERLRYVRSDPVGRAAALNRALSMASHDVCAIADIDDLSIPARLEWTSAFFAENPHADCVSFFAFTDHKPARAAPPLPSAPCSIRVRSLLNMPVPFPAFAFRRSAFGLPFDTDRRAGVDCDWLYRNFEVGEADGPLIPMPAVYYRMHDDQISATHQDERQSVALNCVYSLHARILERDVTPFKGVIQRLTRWTPISKDDELEEVLEYCGLLQRCLEGSSYCDAAAASEHLRHAWTELRHRHMSAQRGAGPGDRDALDSALVAGLGTIVRRFSSQKALKKFEREPRRFFKDMVLRRLPRAPAPQRTRR